MAAVRQQQLISSGMDPTHARIHATRAGRDAQAMGYSSSAYGSEDEKQQVRGKIFPKFQIYRLRDRDLI